MTPTTPENTGIASLPEAFTEMVDFFNSPAANDLLPPTHPDGPRRMGQVVISPNVETMDHTDLTIYPDRRMKISTRPQDWDLPARVLLFGHEGSRHSQIRGGL